MLDMVGMVFSCVTFDEMDPLGQRVQEMQRKVPARGARCLGIGGKKTFGRCRAVPGSAGRAKRGDSENRAW